MEEGATAQKIAMTPEESQFLQTRQYQAEEVARWLNLPPHKVGVSVGARPGGNLESSQTEFYMDSIRPWLVRIEKEANHKLFPDGNDDYYIEHEADAILRGDSQTRYENYSKAISSRVHERRSRRLRRIFPSRSSRSQSTRIRLQTLRP